MSSLTTDDLIARDAIVFFFILPERTYIERLGRNQSFVTKTHCALKLSIFKIPY